MLYPVELQTQQKRDLKIAAWILDAMKRSSSRVQNLLPDKKRPEKAVVRPLLESVDMNSTIDLFGHSTLRGLPLSLWERIINDEELRGCSDLEKLLAGCEIIAALDGRDLLAT